MKIPTARAALLSGFTGALALLALAAPPDPPIVLTERRHHLGDDQTPDWTDTTAEPEGARLELAFEASANTGPWALEIGQADVNQKGLAVRLNGQVLGELPARPEAHTHWLSVPRESVRAGHNELTFTLADPSDDVVIGPVTLHRRSLREVLDLVRAVVRLRDPQGAPLPARVTVVREADGQPPELWFAESERTAVRPGIVYGVGQVAFEVPAGRYTVYASRGVEWSRAREALVLGPESAAPLELTLERQVDTRGWIAADTHIHTLTFSGHGDASLEERIVTLAGDGVELAVATDHNHNTDYRPAQARLGFGDWYTAAVGNEVTTDNGHFNAFPLDPAAAPPDPTLPDWVDLVRAMRAKGAGVVILNHPRWPRPDDCPLARFAFDPRSGERTGPAFTFDAMELVNSTWDVPDPDAVLRDWFGVLNGGERVSAVGSSDSHTVGDPTGQGRTYLPSASDDPAAIDVDAAARALREGRGSVSLGLVARARVGSAGMGDRVTLEGDSIPLEVRVQGPAWSNLRRVRAFLNGQRVAEVEVSDGDGEPFDETVQLLLQAPPGDAWLVAVASGDPIQEPFWHSLNPYVYAATNPIWIDRDGDGKVSTPREIALGLLPDFAADPAGTLARVDQATAIQLVRAAREDPTRSASDWAPTVRKVAAERGWHDLEAFAAR